MYNQVFSRSPKDQLYMIEFLVHELKVINTEDLNSLLAVALKFAKIPTIEVNQDDFSRVKEIQTGSITTAKTIQFDVGKSCLFSSCNQELKNWIRKEPVVVNILKARSIEDTEFGNENEEKPIGQTEIGLIDYFPNIDEREEIFNEPKTLKNSYDLRDQLGRPFGTINICLRLSCFGKLLATKFALQNESLLFKTGHSLNEFQCAKIPQEENVKENNFETVNMVKSDSSSLGTQDILALNLVCEDLTKTDGGPAVNIPEEEREKESSQRIPNQKLMFQPKRNSNIPNCIFSKTDMDSPSLPKYFAHLDKQEDVIKTARMRGGACDEITDDLFKNCQDPSNSDCYCTNVPTTIEAGDCSGVYCFQKCIKEAQEILDSFGKKNGFAGLGILGPLESPYFGRKRDNEYAHLVKAINELDSQFGHPADVNEQKNIPYTDISIPTKTKRKENDGENREENPVKSFNDRIYDQFYKESEFKENLANSDKMISNILQKSDNYMKRPSKITSQTTSKTNGKRKKCRKMGLRKKKRKIQQIKSYTPMANWQSTPKTSIKVSKHVKKQARLMQECNPGIYYGHRNCVDMNMRIPPNMGWLWNTCENPGIPKPRYGWRPGAISKHVYNLLMKAKSESGVAVPERTASLTLQGRRSKSPKSKSYHSLGKTQSKFSFKDKLNKDKDKEEEPPPLIQIQRKDGNYYVTINPAKQVDPEAKPLKLKIPKNEDDDKSLLNAQNSLKNVQQKPKIETKDTGTQVKQEEIIVSQKTPTAKPEPKLKEKTKKVDVKKRLTKK